ncbi:MAG: GNAT family N-acetyltransferase [Actinomycetota bacterium]|nr:GNAT family N-acetyltransferase [Actinomycetota bacterium]
MRRRAGKELSAGGPPRLETGRLLLRALTPDDAAAIFAYASDPEVARYMVWEAHRSMEDTEAFLDLTMSHYESGDAPDWGMVYKGDGRLVGTCGFVAWERGHARAEAGYVLHRGYWGMGLTSEALRAMISFGFERMDLNRIEARCIAENSASARVMEKAGMSYEGTMRGREFLKGEYRDMKLYAILKDDPLRPSSR